MIQKPITDLEEIKKIEVQILDYVVRFCDEYNLKYFLAYGTLLGAVRHGGFIPWDDDIDILMPREDYEKLKKLWLDEKQDKYKLLSCDKDKKYIYPFMKVIDKRTKLEECDTESQVELGVYIDIFPYDGVPNESYKRKKCLKRCELLEKLRVFSTFNIENIMHKDKKKNLFRKPIWRLLQIIGPARISRHMEKFITKISVKDAKWQGCLCTRFSYREIMPREVWDGVTEVNFEGKMYKAPKNYETMLKTNYGNYMELPPEEDRCLKHNFKVWKYVEE